MYKKLYEYLNDNEVFLITSPHNLMYYTGFSGGEGIGVIGKNLLILITDSRYFEAAEKEAGDFEILESVPYTDALKELFIKNGINKVYFENDSITVSQYERIKEKCSSLVEMSFGSEILENERMIKSDTEISFIKKAADIASDAYNHVINIIKEGITEIELASEIEYLMRKRGAQKTSFDTIVVFGKNSSLPHGIPGNDKLRCGDFITMDFGCVYKGYCSDMTRTVVFGKASEKQREIYNTVLEAQLTALKYLSEGRLAKDADAVARNIIFERGYGKFFGHSLGHGVGLKIHELPNLSQKSEITLKENMVVTCEPGIYIPDFGGVRIEDLVVIQKQGIMNLTLADKNFTEL